MSKTRRSIKMSRVIMLLTGIIPAFDFNFIVMTFEADLVSVVASQAILYVTGD
jgi:hypothetical protein